LPTFSLAVPTRFVALLAATLALPTFSLALPTRFAAFVTALFAAVALPTRFVALLAATLALPTRFVACTAPLTNDRFPAPVLFVAGDFPDVGTFARFRTLARLALDAVVMARGLAPRPPIKQER
jgi:hypothetical protein